jgi:hypothetical protein
MSRTLAVLWIGLFLLAPPLAEAQETEKPETEATAPQPPVELGTIDWFRDFEAGLAEVKETGKPMLLLFQEVPG